MTSKELLRQIYIIDCQIKNLLDERASITLLKSSVLDGVYVQTSRSSEPPWMKSIIEWDQLTETITRKADMLIKTKHEIISRINSLPDARYIKLLTEKYLHYKSLEQIAEEMNYCDDHVKRLHAQAIKAFSMTINQNPGRSSR